MTICNLFLMRKKKELKLTSDIIVYVEEARQNQSLCYSWYKVRVDQITGSTLHQVIHASVETLPMSFILNICVEKNIQILIFLGRNLVFQIQRLKELSLNVFKKFSFT